MLSTFQKVQMLNKFCRIFVHWCKNFGSQSKVFSLLPPTPPHPPTPSVMHPKFPEGKEGETISSGKATPVFWQSSQSFSAVLHNISKYWTSHVIINLSFKCFLLNIFSTTSFHCSFVGEFLTNELPTFWKGFLSQLKFKKRHEQYW